MRLLAQIADQMERLNVVATDFNAGRLPPVERDPLLSGLGDDASALGVAMLEIAGIRPEPRANADHQGAP